MLRVLCTPRELAQAQRHVPCAPLCLGDAFHGCVQWTGGVVEPPARCPLLFTVRLHIPALPSSAAHWPFPPVYCQPLPCALSLEASLHKKSWVFCFSWSHLCHLHDAQVCASLNKLTTKYLIRNIIAQNGPKWESQLTPLSIFHKINKL